MPLNYDGVTDDRAILQAMIDATPAGGRLELDPDRVCRLVIDLTVPDRGLIMKPNVELVLNGTMLNFECHDAVYGTRMKSGSRIRKGRVNIAVSAGVVGDQGIYHTPVALGDAYGERTDMINRGPYLEAVDWGIHDLEVSTVKLDGLLVAGLGGMRDGHISDIRSPDSNKPRGLINFDWGTIGTPASMTQNKVNFLNGTYRTVHPSNIVVERIKAGNFSNPNAEIIRLSACNGIDIRNVLIKGCGYTGYTFTGGDQGFEYCEYGVARTQAYMNNALRGMTIQSTSKHAIKIEAWADNVSREPNYTPLGPENSIYPTNLLIEGVVADSATGVDKAMMLGSIKGLTVRQCRWNAFHIGADYATGVSRMLYEDCVLHGSNSTAIPHVGDASGVTENRVAFEY